MRWTRAPVLPSAAVGVVADVVDQVLEVPVAPSFTRIGPVVRSRLDHWGRDVDLAGRVAVVTGATSGLGLATTRAFLAAGRDRGDRGARRGEGGRGSRPISSVAAPGRVGVVVADVGDLDAVRSAAAALVRPP